MAADNQLNQVLRELKELRAELRAPAKMLLTVDETAQALALAPKTVRNQLSAGTFPIKAVRSAGGVRFRREDLVAYVDSLGGAE
jgi:hypothetical protein